MANAATITQGAVREMLVMAVECAFDFRLGRRASPYLDQFDARYATLTNALAAILADQNAGNLRMLAKHARWTLTEFFETVQREVVVGVEAGMDHDSPAFEAILAKVRDSAVAAGGAVGYLELALRKT